MSLSAKEIKQLRGLLSKVSIGSKPKKQPRRRKRRGANPPGIPAGQTRAVSAMGGSNSGGANGEIMVSRTELLGSIDLEANTAENVGLYKLVPTADNLSWLAKLVVAFDRIEWLSCTVVYKPFVGTSSSGSVAFSPDWDSATAKEKVTRAKIQAGSPVYESPVWQAGKIVLPSKYLQSRRYYSLHGAKTDPFDQAPCQILWSIKGAEATGGKTSLGELWITYKVRLSGTSA